MKEAGGATAKIAVSEQPTPSLAGTSESTIESAPSVGPDAFDNMDTTGSFLDTEFASWLDSYNLQMDSWMDVFYPDDVGGANGHIGT